MLIMGMPAGRFAACVVGAAVVIAAVVLLVRIARR